MAESTVLNLVLWLPVLGMAVLALARRMSDRQVRSFTFAVMLLQLALTAWLYCRFDGTVAGLQFETRVPWIADWGVSYHIGLDGINILLVMLTAFLGPLVVAGAFAAIQKNVKLFYAMVFFIQFAMMGTFVAQDLFLFYVFWEAMLIPMFLIIGIWGGERRIYATLKFVLYTAFGSILMLAAVIYLVLAALYESWAVPFAVLLATPFGFMGALFALKMLGVPFNVYGQIGLVTLVVQVNGKLRDKLTVSATATEAEIEALALASPKVQIALEGRAPKKVIHAGGRLINIVG